MDAAIRAESDSGKACNDKIVKRADPSPTRMWVLKPAGFRLTSLSRPTTALRIKPNTSLTTSSISKVKSISFFHRKSCIYT
jgi:hypothetical protein